MTFPDTKYSDAGAYVDAYFDQYAKAAKSVERGALGLAAEILRKA